MDLSTGQVLAEKLKFSTPDTEQLCQALLPLPDLQAKQIIQTTRTPPCYFFSFRCQEVWKPLMGQKRWKIFESGSPNLFWICKVSELIAKDNWAFFVLITFWIYRSFHFEVFTSETLPDMPKNQQNSFHKLKTSLS